MATTFIYSAPVEVGYTYGVRDEFADMFQFKAMLFLREIACCY